MKTDSLMLLAAAFLFSCNAENTQSTKQTDNTPVMVADTIDPAAIPPKEDVYAGEYRWGDITAGYYQTLHIRPTAAGTYAVRFSATAVKGKAGCNFEGSGTILNDTLKVPLEWRNKRVNMTLFARGDSIQVFTEKFDDRFALNYYCSGGGSLAGDYYRIVAK